MNIKEAGGQLFDRLREQCPLIHNITNYVTVNDCANAVLAIGASPIMADDVKEVTEITALADALVINIGTLNQRVIPSMLAAGRQANEKQIPVIIDPVGVGISAFRSSAIDGLLSKLQPSIIRGNLAELSYIAGLPSMARGVDSSAADSQREAEEVAMLAAGKYGCVAAITGAVDVVSDGQRIIRLYNGHQSLTKITGTGCMTSAMTGACAAAGEDMLLAAVCGVAAMGISGELAWEMAGGRGLGSLHTALFDAISRLNGSVFAERVKFDEA